MNKNIRRQLLNIYRQADLDVTAAGPVCEASGRCCRFTEYGHTLFLSNMEAEYLLANATDFETPVSADACPFQKDNLCTARATRPLGCRVYFCDTSYQETANQITEKHLRHLKDLAVSENLDWEYAPLHHFLNKMKPGGVQQTATDSALPKIGRSRIALTVLSEEKGSVSFNRNGPKGAAH